GSGSRARPAEVGPAFYTILAPGPYTWQGSVTKPMESRFPRNDERRPGIRPVGRRSDPPGAWREWVRTAATRMRYVCPLSVYQTDEAPGCHTRQPGASFCWRSLGILSTKPPGGASVESVRRHPRAGTRIRLVLVPSRNPGRFAPKLRGASVAASDLATVSLGPNSLASCPGAASRPSSR